MSSSSHRNLKQNVTMHFTVARDALGAEYRGRNNSSHVRNFRFFPEKSNYFCALLEKR